MKLKNNFEYLKLLIPDYLTGEINSSDRDMLEKGFIEYPELKELCHDFQNTLKEADKIVDDEPPVYYWNNLLANIHIKIDAETKPSILKIISLSWKILVPIAAVLLIFILYRAFNTEQSEIVQLNDNTQKEEIIADDSIIQEKDKQIAENNSEEKNIKKNYSEDIYNENYNLKLQDTNSSDYVLTEENNDNVLNEILDETDYIESEDIYDEYESDYNTLNEKEKKEIIESIKNIKI